MVSGWRSRGTVRGQVRNREVGMKHVCLAVAARVLVTLFLALGLAITSTGLTESAPVYGKTGKAHKHGKQDKDNGKKKGKGKKVKVVATPNYTVTVDCDYDDDSDQTTCEVAASAPSGAKNVQHVDLSAEEICAPVIGGDADYANPDPHTGVAGFRSHGTEARFSLVLSGQVATGGSANYWIKAASAIFPVRGPGFDCEPEQAAETPVPNATTTPPQLTPEVSDSTGAILVRAYECPIATAQEDYDWHGQCQTASSGLRFRLIKIDTDTRDGLATSTSSAGEARFGMLQPGTYELTLADGDWCFAQSDSVDSDGDVIISAGERTTVWIFICQSETTGLRSARGA
jgi:hypothetical protein